MDGAARLRLERAVRACCERGQGAAVSAIVEDARRALVSDALGEAPDAAPAGMEGRPAPGADAAAGAADPCAALACSCGCGGGGTV